MDPRLAVIVSKNPQLKNVYKSNGRCLKKSNNKGNNLPQFTTLDKIEPLVGY